MTRRALAEQLSTRVAELLAGDIVARGMASLIVSGGSTPVTFFELLSTQPIEWHKVQVSLADERMVGPEHKDSNTRLVKTHLLQHEAASAEFIPRVINHADPAENLSRAETLDLGIQKPYTAVILGMGEDGHFASLFPGAEGVQSALDVANTASPLVSITPEHAPYDRISMTLSALLNTQHLMLHIHGSTKKAVLEKAKTGLQPELPISFVLHQTIVKPQVFWAE